MCNDYVKLLIEHTTSGHVRVTVSPNGVTVDYVRSYLDKPDEVAFTYTVK
jgi:hypothetical protein